MYNADQNSQNMVVHLQIKLIGNLEEAVLQARKNNQKVWQDVATFKNWQDAVEVAEYFKTVELIPFYLKHEPNK